MAVRNYNDWYLIHKEELMKKITAIRDSGKFINFFHFMLDLDQGPCAIKRLRGCGCGNE